MNVACVLRSGGDFGPEWVYALRAGVDQYLKTPHRFLCLTDMDAPGVDTYRLAHDWPGWWSKVELFTPGLFDGPVLYMDLDTLPVGWLLDLTTYSGDFAMLNDFYRGRKQVASGVMAWTPGPHTNAIYASFVEEGRIPSGRSDFWYQRHAPDPDRLQDLFPGQLVSLKAHCNPPKAKGPPKNARLVCGHGRPRLSSPGAGWAHELWRERVEMGVAV